MEPFYTMYYNVQLSIDCVVITIWNSWTWLKLPNDVVMLLEDNLGWKLWSHFDVLHKAGLLQEGIIHLFARDVLVMKELEIKKN